MSDALYDVVGIGNAIVDVVTNADDAFLEAGAEMLSTEACPCGDAAITYTADETIPYCSGIDDLLDE